MKNIFLIIAILLLCTVSFGKTKELACNSELYQGPEYSRAFSNPVDHPNLPNVLLIGDSISIGYTVEVRKLLQGKADVFRIPVNGRDSSFGNKNLTKWLKVRQWDVVHFNWGLWDLCYRNPKSKSQGHLAKLNGKLTATLNEYEKFMRKNVELLKANTKAKLIWCETTPVPEHEPGRIVGDSKKYNAVANRIMSENNIVINPLYVYAKKKQDVLKKSRGNVHFTPQGYAYLAKQVAQIIEKQLPN